MTGGYNDIQSAIEEQESRFEKFTELSTEVNNINTTISQTNFQLMTVRKQIESLEDEIKAELSAKLKDVMSEAPADKKDESSCVGEMKKLNDSGCTKEAMKKKITAAYDVDDKKFEKLYAAHCAG